MILVTGGLGFIGSAYIWYLNQKGIDDIVIYDRFRNEEKWKNVRNLKFRDIILSDQTIAEMEKYNFSSVIHLGACSATTEKDMDFLYRNNFELSRDLWYVATGMGIPYVYASSAATYGAGEHGFSDQMDIDKLVPLNKYGFSKQLFDRWVEGQVNSGNHLSPPHYAGLKFFNVFGPNEYHKGSMASVVFHAYQQIISEGKVKLFRSYRKEYEDGKQLRDFIYVKDACEAIETHRTALSENENENSSKNIPSGIYNVGSGQARSFQDLVLAVFSALNLPPKIEYIEMPESIRDRYQYFTKAERGKEVGGVNSQVIQNQKYLENQVADYVKNYLTQANPYLRI